jgi:hypothetical protein
MADGLKSTIYINSVTSRIEEEKVLNKNKYILSSSSYYLLVRITNVEIKIGLFDETDFSNGGILFTSVVLVYSKSKWLKKTYKW